jgi:Flp pilus assembly pilin Flp
MCKMHLLVAFWRGFRQLRKEQEATTATEYAVMLSMMLMVMLGALQFYGTSLNSLFGTISDTLFSA